MGRKRNVLRYNSAGLFLSDSPAHAPKSDPAGNSIDSNNIYFLNRVQSTTLSIDVVRQDIPQMGSEDFLDRKIVSEPTINLNFDYFLTDGYEENTLGLNIAFSGTIFPTKSIYRDLREDKNIFLLIGQEGFDLAETAKRPYGYSGMDAIGIGNCFITSYSIKAGIGELASASVGMTASNVRYSCVGSGSGGYTWLSNIMDLGYMLYELNDEMYLEEEGEPPDDGSRLESQLSNAAKYGQGLPFPSFYLANGATDPVGHDIIYTTTEEDGTEITKIITPGTGFELGMPLYVLEGESQPFMDPLGASDNPIIYKSPVGAIPPHGITMKVKNINVGGPVISGDNVGTCTKGSAYLQNFSITLPFAREDLYGFSSMHVYGRKMKYPQVGQISLSLLASAFETGNFKDLFCDDEIYEIEIELTNECNVTCNPSSLRDPKMLFRINNAKLNGYSLSQQIGSPGTVDVDFSFGVSTNNGLFMSGSFEAGNYIKREEGGDFIFSEGGFKILEEDVSPVV